MISIELQDVHLHAYHGIFEGEETTGNPYVLNLQVKYDEIDLDFDDINKTINYAELYSIVQRNMEIRTGLLEKVCDNIIRNIRQQYPFIAEVEISIFKLQAPIKELEGKVGVRMNRKF